VLFRPERELQQELLRERDRGRRDEDLRLRIVSSVYPLRARERDRLLEEDDEEEDERALERARECRDLDREDFLCE